MVRTKHHKLVAVHGQDAGELYDLEEDPHETHNRWADAGYQTIKMEMLKRLCDRMAWTVDPRTRSALTQVLGGDVQGSSNAEGR